MSDKWGLCPSKFLTESSPFYSIQPIKAPIVYRNVKESIDCSIRIRHREPRPISDLALRLNLGAFPGLPPPEGNIEYTYVDSWVDGRYGLILVPVDTAVGV